MSKNTNILIIGGAGFIGSNLVIKLTEEGYKVVVFEQKECNTHRLPISNNLIIEFGALSDVTNFENILRKFKIDIVIHLASSIIPSSDQNAFISDIENILTPTVTLLALISSLGIKFYYFSSGGTVYGNRLNNNQSILENEETNPISYYGISKLFIEKLILMENIRTNLSYIILRPSNLYGPGQNVDGNQGLIAVILGKIIKGEEVTIWGDGENVRDYIYIDDLISCVSKLLRSDVNNEILNVGSGKGQSVNDIIEVIRNVSHQQVKVNYDIRRSVDVSVSVLNSTKLLRHIDVNFTSIEEGVSKFYKHLTNNH
jgi:UDP-glucose 4-epimerase